MKYPDGKGPKFKVTFPWHLGHSKLGSIIKKNMLLFLHNAHCYLLQTLKQTLALLQEQGFIVIFILEKNIFWGEQEKTTKNTLSTLHRFLQRTSPFQKREMNEFS